MQNEALAVASPSSAGTLKDNKTPKSAILPKPGMILPSVEQKSPNVLKVLYSLMDRKDDWKNSTELLSLIGILSCACHRMESNALQLKVWLHLHALGTPCHVLEMLHHMGMCSYHVISNTVKQISKTTSQPSSEVQSRQQSQQTSPMGPNVISSAVERISVPPNDQSLEVLHSQQSQQPSPIGHSVIPNTMTQISNTTNNRPLEVLSSQQAQQHASSIGHNVVSGAVKRVSEPANDRSVEAPSN